MPKENQCSSTVDHLPVEGGLTSETSCLFRLFTKIVRDEFDQVVRQALGGGVETANNPRIITDYNPYMSRVDKADQLMVYYACGRKSLKWYTRIFWRILDHTNFLCFFILHTAFISPNHTEFTHKRFRMELAYAFKAHSSVSARSKALNP